MILFRIIFALLHPSVELIISTRAPGLKFLTRKNGIYSKSSSSAVDRYLLANELAVQIRPFLSYDVYEGPFY